jgi:hypothetical protein
VFSIGSVPKAFGTASAGMTGNSTLWTDPKWLRFIEIFDGIKSYRIDKIPYER